MIKTIEKSIEKIKKIGEEYPFLDFLSENAVEMHSKLVSSELILPLIGEFSSGKTSLMNALLGGRILAVDIPPTTSIINEVRFSGKEERIEIYFEGGERAEYDHLFDLKQGGIEGATFVKIHSKSVILPMEIVLVDAPGLSSDIEKHEKILMDYIPRSDAILLVIDVNQGVMTRTTERFLNIIEAYKKRIFLIYTKSESKSQGELAELKTYAETSLSFKPDRVIFTSAKNGDIGEFVALLREIHSQSREILGSNIAREIVSLCDKGISLLELQISSSELDNREIDSKIKETTAMLEELNNRIQAVVSETKNRIQDSIERCESHFQMIMRDSIPGLVDMYFSDSDNLERAFDDSMRAAANKSVEMLSADVQKVMNDLKINIEAIAGEINIGRSLAPMVSRGIVEGLFLVLLNVVLPGEWIPALLARLGLRLPIIKHIAAPLEELIKAMTKLLSKRFVQSKIEEAVENACYHFRQELEREKERIFADVDQAVSRSYEGEKKNLIESLQSLKMEKEKQRTEFIEYLKNLKRAKNQLETIKIEIM